MKSQFKCDKRTILRSKSMIEIKCSKAQFNRIITNLAASGYSLNSSGNAVCILGKSYHNCPAINGKSPELTCTQCLNKNIKRI